MDSTSNPSFPTGGILRRNSGQTSADGQKKLRSPVRISTVQVDDGSSLRDSFEKDSRTAKSPLFSLGSDKARRSRSPEDKEDNFTIHWVERIALRQIIKKQKEEKAAEEAKLFGKSAKFLKSDNKSSR